METNKIKRYTSQEVECRADAEAGKNYIKGRAIIYDSPYPMWEDCVEYIAKGALDGADLSDVIASFNHEDECLLGRTVNGEGTLTLTPDANGLVFEVEANDTTASKDCLINVQLKNIRGCSFEFTVGAEDWAYDVLQPDGTKMTVRTITSIKKLYAVNPVVYPAYVETEIESMKRSVEHNKPKQPSGLDMYYQIKTQK
jgi:HK97 family phage prohead protease